MKYKAGYKYQLVERTNAPTGITPVGEPRMIRLEYLSLLWDGVLVIKSGYAWDGPSGPVRDRKKLMRASLVHDALYQLIREGLLPVSEQDKADRLFQQMCIEDGVPRLMAWMYYQGLKRFGKRAATKPKKVHEV